MIVYSTGCLCTTTPANLPAVEQLTRKIDIFAHARDTGDAYLRRRLRYGDIQTYRPAERLAPARQLYKPWLSLQKTAAGNKGKSIIILESQIKHCISGQAFHLQGWVTRCTLPETVVACSLHSGPEDASQPHMTDIDATPANVSDFNVVN